MAWQIEGEYIETCNCSFICPCIASNLAARRPRATARRRSRCGSTGATRTASISAGSPSSCCCTRPARWRTATSRSASSSTSGRRGADRGDQRDRLGRRRRADGGARTAGRQVRGRREAADRFEIDGMTCSVKAGELVDQAVEGVRRVAKMSRSISKTSRTRSRPSSRSRRPLAAGCTRSASTGTTPAARATAISRRSAWGG